jgi:predicted DNA-binding transcriptional regulator AlpA
MSNSIEGIENLIREMIREEVTAILDKQSLPIAKPTLPVERERPPSDRLLKAGEVAEVLGISILRVYDLSRQRKANGFPVITIGERQYRFSRERIYEWLEAGQKKNEP